MTGAAAAAVETARLAAGDAVTDLALEPIDADTRRFRAYLPCRAGEPVRLEADTVAGPVSLPIVLPYEPLLPAPSPDLFARFIDLVNREKSSVLEVGSRTSSPVPTSNRRHFAPGVRFIGFDVLPGPNTDVVGDAHALSQYFPERSLGAAYSLTVLEHLLMPWRFAVELNRVLEIGGLVYHATHQTWPLHAEPNDFYRFSSEALAFLFGPDAGFEVIDAHMEHRVWMYPEDRTAMPYLEMPLFPGYGNSQVLARKVRDVEPAHGVWDVNAAHLAARSRAYPVAPGA